MGALCCFSALFDVEANIVQIVALQFSPVTTVLLLGSGGVLPAVLVLGTLFAGHKYSRRSWGTPRMSTHMA